MQITLPTSYEVPSGVKPGEPFDVSATLVKNEDGTFNLVAIDGVDLDTDKEQGEGAEQSGEPAEGPPQMGQKRMQMPWDQ
jgi:hypothetical protein